MIETFLYLAQNFEQLNAYEADFKLSSQENDFYKETYQSINKLCTEKGLKIPYVFFQNKVYFLADNEDISNEFITLFDQGDMNKQKAVVSVSEREKLFMRLVRNAILLKTSSFHPQSMRYGLEYPIDSEKWNDIIIHRNLNVNFSLLSGSNIMQIIFDLKSRANAVWSALTATQKLYCSLSPNERYKAVKNKIIKIFGDVDDISLELNGNPSLCFKRVKL